MKTFLEISISASPTQREILIPSLTELGCQGFEETDESLLCYFDKSAWTADAFPRFQTELKSILQTFSVNASIRFKEITETNWNEEWERSIKPIAVGNRFLIKPSWAAAQSVGDRIVLEIDPKMSFGTGYHESTRLILRLLEDTVVVNDDVLDIGTGTGILAIAAIKLGAARASGIDIDEWSIENASENAIRNGVDRNLVISDDPLSVFPAAHFPLILANIMASTIIDLLPEIKRVQTPGGRLLLAGLLATDRQAITEALNRHGYSAARELTENEWIAIAARLG